MARNDPKPGTWHCSQSGHDTHRPASNPEPSRCHLCDSIAFYVPRTKPEPQDIPFYPDYFRRELPPEHHKTWCIAARLTERLRARGFTLAITPARNKAMEAAHAAEVRAAVTARLQDIARREILKGYVATTVETTAREVVAAILADPAVKILTDHSDRLRNGD